MAAGIQVFTNSGNLQVDSEFSNLVFDGAFQVNVPRGSSTTPGYVESAASTDYMYAYRTAAGYDGIPISMYQQPGKLMFIAGQAGGAVVNVFRFAKNAGRPAMNAGLEVFSASGALCFSSGNRYMRVLDFMNNYSPLGSTGGDFTRQYSRRPAVLIGTLGASGTFSRRGGDPEGEWRWLQRFSTFAFSGNGISFSSSGIATLEEGFGGGAAFDDYSSNASSALVIDATDL